MGRISFDPEEEGLSVSFSGESVTLGSEEVGSEPSRSRKGGILVGGVPSTVLVKGPS
jgi:hypothetical protein